MLKMNQKECGRKLLIQPFAWAYCGKQWETSVRTTGLEVEIKILDLLDTK
jgi:hypothetical protein